MMQSSLSKYRRDGTADGGSTSMVTTMTAADKEYGFDSDNYFVYVDQKLDGYCGICGIDR